MSYTRAAKLTDASVYDPEATRASGETRSVTDKLVRNTQLAPRPGLLLCFPSSHEYRHTVLPVTRGERFALVTWMRVKGWRTMSDEAREIAEEARLAALRGPTAPTPGQ
jgi:predicted 2-oxoglutarate/Fe(II)-dependent dioxygenase YbiX